MLIYLFYIPFISLMFYLLNFMFYFTLNIDLQVLYYIYEFLFCLPILHQFTTHMLNYLFYFLFTSLIFYLYNLWFIFHLMLIYKFYFKFTRLNSIYKIYIKLGIDVVILITVLYNDPSSE